MKHSFRQLIASWRLHFVMLFVLTTLVGTIGAQDRAPLPTTPGKADTRLLNEIRLKLKLIANAMLMHEQELRSLPPPRDRAGKPVAAGLSWRVHLLPYVGEVDLYEEFHFDEPWDSPHNLKLAARMPDIYRLEGSRDAKTRFRVFTGPDSLFGSSGSVRDARDGRTHTILVIAGSPALATPWTQPDEPIAATDPAKFWIDRSDPTIECVMADGQLLTLSGVSDSKHLAALATPRGGEIVDAEALRRRAPSVANAPAPGGKPARAESTVSRKLKDIAVAMLEYHDTYKCFPVVGKPDYYNEGGQAKLSWRVHLLPHLSQQPLYDRFHLNENWDSPHNLELLKFIPEIYREEGLNTSTRMVTIQGEFALFGKKAPKMFDVSDGNTHTVLVVQAGVDKAVPWTKPDDNYFDPTRPFACIGSIDQKGLATVMVDGAVWVFRPTLSPEIFSALVTPRGKEVINAAELSAARQF